MWQRLGLSAVRLAPWCGAVGCVSLNGVLSGRRNVTQLVVLE
jgi:hypothetical protein